MKPIFLILSFVVLISTKPIDTDEPYDESNGSGSGSSSSDEQPKIATGIFTKYPDDPADEYSIPETFELAPDEIRLRRNVNESLTNRMNSTLTAGGVEGKTEEPTKVPLRGLINAVESDLVTQALEIAVQRRRRNANSSEGYDDRRNETAIDVNQDLFGGLFNLTRSHRGTGNKEMRIPLDSLLEAVESTLVHSAQNIRDQKTYENETSEESTTKVKELAREKRDNESEDRAKAKAAVDSDMKAEVQVQELNPKNLNILSPITFKSVSVPPAAESTTVYGGESTDTTVPPDVHESNFTVIESSDTVSLIPGTGEGADHVQHQAISKTVFHSNLAIFPTFESQKVNALRMTTEKVPLVDTTASPKTTEASKKKEEEDKQAELSKLKEKFEEIQATPVILSQF